MYKLIFIIVILALLAAIGVSVGGILSVFFGIILLIAASFLGLFFGLIFIFNSDGEGALILIGLLILISTIIIDYFLMGWMFGGWESLVMSVKELL